MQKTRSFQWVHILPLAMLYSYVFFYIIYKYSPKSIKQHKIIIQWKAREGMEMEMRSVSKGSTQQTNKITLTPVLPKNYVPAIDDSSIKTN